MLRLQLHFLEDPGHAVQSNDLVEVFLFRKAVAGDCVLAVPVHLAATASARVSVFAAALEARAETLIPKVEEAECPEAVGEGRVAVLKRALKLFVVAGIGVR